MSDESSEAATTAARWVVAGAVIGLIGVLWTVRTDPWWPQALMGIGGASLVGIVWRAPQARAALRWVVLLTLAPVIWQIWGLWQGRWAVSVWLGLTAVALLVLLTVGVRTATRLGSVPGGSAGVAAGAVIVLTLTFWLGGGLVASQTAAARQSSAADPDAVSAGDGGNYAYGWRIGPDIGPKDTAFGTLTVDVTDRRRVSAVTGGEQAWSFELRPYRIFDVSVSSSGEVVMLQLSLPTDVAVQTDPASRVARVWLDAGTGAVLDSISWNSVDATPRDSGEEAAVERTGREWVIYEPIGNDTVTYQDLLVGRYRIDTNVRVGLAFAPGEPQQLAWDRQIPQRCGEQVIWSRLDRVWTLAATASVLAVERICLGEPDADGVPLVTASVHGVDAATGTDVWAIDTVEQVRVPEWTADYPRSDEARLSDALGGNTHSSVAMAFVSVEFGESPTDPVLLTFRPTAGESEESERMEEVTVDLATGQ